MRRIAFLAIGLWSCSVWASFELAPIIAKVSPSGPGATASFTVTNTDDTRTPVQISIYKREPDIDGVEKYVESKEIGELFQVFPAQVILGPKEKRTVRVTYVGDPKIQTEIPFRIVAEEFPINVSDPNRVKDRAVASISLASRYIGSLYVSPVGVKPNLVIDASPGTNKTEREMVLMMANKGTEHILLKGAKFKVVAVASNSEFQLAGTAFPNVIGQNILAGKTRKFVVPWPKDVPVGPVKVTVEVAKQ